MAAGVFIVLRMNVVQERAELQVLWPVIGTLALIAASSPLDMDLRFASNNAIYLGLVLAGYGLLDRRPLLAGVLVGLSISLKLYSGLIILWLVLHDPRRATYAGVATVVMLWLVLPIALFGADGALKLYAGWREQLRIMTDSWVYYAQAQGFGLPITTLRTAAIRLTGQGPDSAAVGVLVLALEAAGPAC
jgi:hypothetical protein